MEQHDNTEQPDEQSPPVDPAPPVGGDEVTQPRVSADAAKDQPSGSALPVAGTNQPEQCAQCGRLMPAHARRCPHCGHLVGGQPIARPERQFAGEAGPSWQEAAARVAEMGALDWETGVHPLNEDTRPVPDPVEVADALVPAPDVLPVPRGHGARWLALTATTLATVLGVMLLVVLPRLNATTSAANLAAAATHAADQAARATAQAGGSDPFATPPLYPTPPPYPTFAPVGAATSTPPPTAHPQPTATPATSTTPTPIPTPIATPVPAQLVIAIDAGGGQAGSYNTDMDVQGGSTYAVNHHIDTKGVADPAPQEVYQTERYGDFTYTIGGLQPNNTYTVRLHFAEIYFNQPNQRVFDVAIQGLPVLTNFDIVATAGGPDIAIVETFPATADPNGTITISFTNGSANINWPKLSGLEIYTLPNGV